MGKPASKKNAPSIFEPNIWGGIPDTDVGIEFLFDISSRFTQFPVRMTIRTEGQADLVVEFDPENAAAMAAVFAAGAVGVALLPSITERQA